MLHHLSGGGSNIAINYDKAERTATVYFTIRTRTVTTKVRCRCEQALFTLASSHLHALLFQPGVEGWFFGDDAGSAGVRGTCCRSPSRGRGPS